MAHNAQLVWISGPTGSLLAAGRCQQAIPYYSKGLEHDQLAERFYQGLMRAHLCLGQRAEGVSVYQRCRQLLQDTLGIQPSGESEAIYLQLRNGQQSAS